MKRTKGFLLHYGWEMGISDAERELASQAPLNTLLKQGPVYHHLNGYINSIIYEADFELGHDQSVKSVKGEGIWLGSYEAEEHIKHLSVSDTPVCHMNIGYLNGYLSTICNHPVIAKEVSCVGMGDEKCNWIVKSKEYWEEDIQDELQYYHQTPIVEELEYTYEQLLEQRNYIMKVSDVHKRLTEDIIKGKDLQSIINSVYEISEIPCMIRDLNFRTLVYSGLTKEEIQNLETDFNESIQGKNNAETLFTETGTELTTFEYNTVISTDLQERLLVPITVSGKIVGYCTFIYMEGKNSYQENDTLILERVANAVSLFLLNEKTSFEAFERMKGSFLEQLLNKQYVLRKEILRRGTYVNMDLSQPFHIIVLGYDKRQVDNMNDEFLLHEQILETAHNYFQGQQRHILISQREGNLVCLISNENESGIVELSHNFLSFLKKSFENCSFKIGISAKGKEIESASKHYDEALVAQRMAVTKKVVSFQDLGIVGVLINSSNVETIKSLASNMLGPFYNGDSIQDDKLIKTLYLFLANGGRLEQTMRDLSLSMSGLLYRINKIESALKKDLRDPDDSHQLFLLLEALVALGQLELE